MMKAQSHEILFYSENLLIFTWTLISVEKEFFGFDEKGERILFMQSEADVDENVSVKKSVLKK